MSPSQNRTAEQPEFLGKGIYTAKQASVLTGIPNDRISDWLRSHLEVHPSVPKTHPAYQVPLWEMLVPAQALKDMVITFHDIIQLKIIFTLRKEGIPLQRIRKAIAKSNDEHGNLYPFIRRQFQLEYKKLYIQLKDKPNADVVMNVDDGQLNLSEFIPKDRRRMERVWTALESLEFDNSGSPYRWWPHGKESGILIDQRVEFGQPIIVRTGIPVEAVVQRLRNGESEKGIQEQFKITPTEIEKAKKFIGFFE